MSENSLIMKIDNVIVKVFAVLCAAFILFDIIIIFISVIARFLGHGIIGVSEMVAMLMPYTAYFGLAYTAKCGSHVQMSAIYEKYKGKMKLVADIIIQCCFLFFFIILFYVSGENFLNAFAVKEKVAAAITLYSWIGKIAMPLGCIALLIHSVIMLISLFKKDLNEKKVEEVEA